MTVTIDRFGEFFLAANGRTPFPWQTRLAKLVFQSGWPACIDLPTASGKTACIDIAVFVAACQVDLPSTARTVGRRIFFTVNRRVIVDEAFERSRSLAQRLLNAESQNTGILHDVAIALRSLNEESDVTVAPPLAIAQLRGGVYRDAAWARSLTQPMIVCTTVDQIGSRMLFRGYGVSDQALPIHAALCSHDTTILLDEAHVTKAFCETLDLLDRYQRLRTHSAPVAAPFQFVQMTATPHGDVQQPFCLDDEDLRHPILQSRQMAAKRASLITIEKKKSLSDQMANDALNIGTAIPRAVGIIVNRVQTARDIAKKLENLLAEKKVESDVHLVIGRMRPIDRDRLQRQLRDLVGPDRPNVLGKSVYVVATQCLEVGADYDFDALLTQCASIDALRQRFGRLNRAGRSDNQGQPIESVAKIYFQEPTEKGEDPIYGVALTETWNWLQKLESESAFVDFGIQAFQKTWEQVETAARSAMLSPSPSAAVLLPAHLDLLCQTSPRPTPEPEVSYFIHGPQRSSADVNVCWRADLGNDPSLWSDVVRLLPPTSLECMPVPIHAIRRWIAGQPLDKSRDADVAITEASDDTRKQKTETFQPITVLRWRGVGDQSLATTDPNAIRPGDTLVVRVQDQGWDLLGHIPYPGKTTQDTMTIGNNSLESPNDPHQDPDPLSMFDVAEECSRLKNLRYVVRLHPAFPQRKSLRSLPANELHDRLKDLIDREFPERVSTPIDAKARQARADLIGVASRAFERHFYPTTDPGADCEDFVRNEVIHCQTLLPRQYELELPTPTSDDEEDDRSQSNHAIALPLHTTHVLEQIRRAINKLGTPFQSTVELAASWHDIGKADVRFQAMLSGLTPAESLERNTELAKSNSKRLTIAERDAIRRRSMLPERFRHEFLSSQIVENKFLTRPEYSEIDCDIVLRLIEAHHGYARPLPHVTAESPNTNGGSLAELSLDDLHSVYLKPSEHWPDVVVDGVERSTFCPPHHLNSGVLPRFWRLTRRLGWWGLAYLESILRLADQRASAAEEMKRK